MNPIKRLKIYASKNIIDERNNSTFSFVQEARIHTKILNKNKKFRL